MHPKAAESAHSVLLLLGLVALVRSVTAYSHQTFPWTICWSICLSSALWKNGGSDPGAVWHLRSNGSRDEAGNRIWERSTVRGTFGANLERHCNKWGLYSIRVRQYLNRRSCGLGWCVRWAEALLYWMAGCLLYTSPSPRD